MTEVEPLTEAELNELRKGLQTAWKDGIGRTLYRLIATVDAARDTAAELLLRIGRDRTAYEVMAKGMESQAELMDDLKQEARQAAALRDTIRCLQAEVDRLRDAQQGA